VRGKEGSCVEGSANVIVCTLQGPVLISGNDTWLEVDDLITALNIISVKYLELRAI